MKEFEWHMPEIPHPEKPSADFLNELSQRLSYALRALVTPRIKGEITKGKLRWRGIKRYSTFIFGDWAYEFYIEDNGSFKVNAIGRPLEPHPEFTYPIILQRKNKISLTYEADFDIYGVYSFWVQKNNVVVFGATSRKSGEYKCSGIMEQITKSE